MAVSWQLPGDVCKVLITRLVYAHAHPVLGMQCLSRRQFLKIRAVHALASPRMRGPAKAYAAREWLIERLT